MSAPRLNALVSRATEDHELSLGEMDDLLSWNGAGFFVDAEEHAALAKLHDRLNRDALANSLAQAAGKLLGQKFKPVGILSSDATRSTLGAFLERSKDTTPRTLVQHLQKSMDGLIDTIR